MKLYQFSAVSLSNTYIHTHTHTHTQRLPRLFLLQRAEQTFSTFNTVICIHNH